MNSNGSSMILAVNGKGMPVFVTTLEGRSFVGAMPLWGTAANASLLLTVSFFVNDSFING